ncbi:MAG TPA: hypothetical protein VFD27_04925, partial [Chthoniobacteraceae bacterium]|nr:hypothetical protein [Chthoniobacteraceae bacterium]
VGVFSAERKDRWHRIAFVHGVDAPRDTFLAENERKPTEEFHGAGEIRKGYLADVGMGFYACVEPMHGNQLVAYIRTREEPRRLLTDKLTEGHALACGDLIGVKSDQIVVGWRGTPGKEGSTIGLHVWTPLDAEGKEWRDTAVDDTGMACEDLQLADLDGDGKLDIIASGRATKNVKIYFNETPR